MREIDYADMLEIPVSTVNVTKKKSKKKKEEIELKDKVVEVVNERVEGVLMDSIVEYGEESESVVSSADGGIPPITDVKVIKKEKRTTGGGFKNFFNSKLLLVEFIVVCALVGTIFLTNVFYQNSAINTFFSNMFGGTQQTQAVDSRSYNELTLSSIVRNKEDVKEEEQVTCTITDNGVMTVQAKCSIYTPHNGKIAKIEKMSDGSYTMTVSHTTKFSTVYAGLTYAYGANGDSVVSTIPIGYTDGNQMVKFTMYNEGQVIQNAAYTVATDNSIVWVK